MKKVTVLDVETDDGGKVVLTILRSGGLSVQTFRARMSAQSRYRLEGAVTLDPEFIREWAETLREKTRWKEPRPKREASRAIPVGMSNQVCRSPSHQTNRTIF